MSIETQNCKCPSPLLASPKRICTLSKPQFPFRTRSLRGAGKRVITFNVLTIGPKKIITGLATKMTYRRSPSDQRSRAWPIQVLAIVALLSACADRRYKVGEICLSESDCQAGATCLEFPDGSDAGTHNRCVATCSASTALCANTEICLRVEGARGMTYVCYPGGDAIENDACSTHADCGLGLLCAPDAAGSNCLPACNTQVSPSTCESNSNCVGPPDLDIKNVQAGACVPEAES